MTETVLHGGDLNVVVRVGDTVRRPTGPWSPAVHALLLHFERVGCGGAPRYLGLDEQGREVLSYIEGEPGHAMVPAGDNVLADLGALLRRLHDAQAEFAAPPGALWQQLAQQPAGALDCHEVVCHYDLFWSNVIFQDGRPIALIDWDLAAPGPRLHDLASAANFWAPLRPDEQARAWGLPTGRRRERLAALCDGYGLPAAERRELVAAVDQLNGIWLAAYHRWGRDERRPGWGEMWDRDQDRYLVAKQQWFDEHRAEVRRWLR